MAHALNRCRVVTDPAGITVWLAVIAIASVLQVLILIAVSVAAFVAYRRAGQALLLMQRQTLNPVVHRVNVVLDDLHDVAGRVQAIDEQVRESMSRTAGTVGEAASAVGSRFWPVIGLARAVRAAMGAVRHSTGERAEGDPHRREASA